MTQKNKTSGLVEVVTKNKPAPNCDITLQIKATYAENGIARGIWEVDDRFMNAIGVAMGGYVAAAADTMMAYAIASVLGPDQSHTSINLHTTFHRGVLPGTVEVEAKVDRLGRTTAYMTAELFQNGKKTASVVSSVLIMEEK